MIGILTETFILKASFFCVLVQLCGLLQRRRRPQRASVFGKGSLTDCYGILWLRFEVHVSIAAPTAGWGGVGWGELCVHLFRAHYSELLVRLYSITGSSMFTNKHMCHKLCLYGKNQVELLIILQQTVAHASQADHLSMKRQQSACMEALCPQVQEFD